MKQNGFDNKVDFFNNCVDVQKCINQHEILKIAFQILLNNENYSHINHHPYNYNKLDNV